MLGHQPAIVSNLEIDPVTAEEVERAIYQQKIGCTAKQLKAYSEHQKKDAHQGKLTLIKKAKVDMRSCPKWKREGITEQDIVDQKADEIGNDNEKDRSRILTCQACGEGMETINMQLLCKEGFRDLYCKKCGRHARSMASNANAV